VRYLGLLLVPVGQNLDYDYPVYRSFLEPRVALSALLLLALGALALAAWGGPLGRWTRRTFDPASRLVAFGLVWFFVALSVESSVIPIADVIFEHRVYLPSVGFFVAAASLGALAAHRLAPARAATATLAAGTLVSVLLGAATLARNEVWSTELALWTDVVAKSPQKSRSRDNLGLALAHRRREAEAIVQFREAVRLDPMNVRAANAHNNLGSVYRKKGWTDQAIEEYQRAIRLKPDFGYAHYNLANAYDDLGLTDQAIDHFQFALRLKPLRPEVHNNLGIAYVKKGWIDKAIEQFEAAVRMDPEAPAFRDNLARAKTTKALLNETGKR